MVGTALGLVLLYASTRKIDPATLVATLRSADWHWVFGILGATCTFIAIKAWRWGVLLRFVPGLRFRELHAAVYVGLAVNFLVAHLGELLRAAVIARRRGVAISAVFVSVLVERTLDFIALLVLLALVFVISPGLPDMVAAATAFVVGLVLAALAGLYLLVYRFDWLQRLAAALTRPLPRRLRDWSLERLEGSRQGLAAITNLRLMTLAVSVSVIQWALVVVAIWCSGLAVGAHVSLVAATVTFVLIVIGLTLPNSPLQIGTTQLAFAVGLGTDGTQATAAIAASLMYTSFLIIPIMIAGGTLMLRLRPLAALRAARVPQDRARVDCRNAST